jgi:hypothetical protein
MLANGLSLRKICFSFAFFYSSIILCLQSLGMVKIVFFFRKKSRLFLVCFRLNLVSESTKHIGKTPVNIKNFSWVKHPYEKVRAPPCNIVNLPPPPLLRATPIRNSIKLSNVFLLFSCLFLICFLIPQFSEVGFLIASLEKNHLLVYFLASPIFIFFNKRHFCKIYEFSA